MIKLSLQQAEAMLALLNDIEEEKGNLLPQEEELQATLEALIDAAKDKQYSPQLAG
ncbi:hypothetical protein KNV09_gp179 [Vibrio phage Athena]|uniref:Uncharacterized protein n=3 Tax=Thalassavirus TaxID=2948922 RepID=A0A6M9Z2H5_9CAUD|nr:hypothetical protein KNV07_gp179 [Vibrio phage Cody]YP_010108537.1 hypothetical protein KNV08_gp183 [Vibrio phage Quinn]YP_010108731.1 hypothetical protein KNV09_gp179 [Vibrio phage Athena]QKN85157.1 hypothetical protein CODY_127 [Vibrio phage Cody]QKN85351.1 hypothetical protein QUINN_127 [Vibrio phage Quinn]QKN85750.1 hypothetical protein ATHENA_128 [Vibrio phage Athena]